VFPPLASRTPRRHGALGMHLSQLQISPVLIALLASTACVPAAGPPVASAATSSIKTAAPLKATPSPALLILAKRDETLSIVNPTTLEVVARVPVGHDPHEVVASPDGKRAYVSNYGGGRYNSLAVVDLTTQTALPAIDLGALRGPHGLDYVGGKVWFTAEGAKVIGSYDPEKGAIDWALGTGEDRTHMILVSSDLKHIITTNVSSGTLSFLEKSLHPRQEPGPPPGSLGPPHPPSGSPGPMGPREDWEQTLVSVGSGTEGFDVSPNGAELWAADAQDGSIAIVDVASKKLVQRLDAKLQGANRLKFSPDGKWVLVSSLRGGDLAVFDAAARAESKRIPIGRGAAGIVVQPDSTRAYVACSPDGYVAVIDLRTMTVAGKIPAGTEPDGLAWVAASSR
jgi:YVTN family beta-propeller protein